MALEGFGFGPALWAVALGLSFWLSGPREWKTGSSERENWLLRKDELALREGKMGELTRELILLVWASGREEKGRINSRVDSFGLDLRKGNWEN